MRGRLYVMDTEIYCITKILDAVNEPFFGLSIFYCHF